MTVAQAPTADYVRRIENGACTIVHYSEIVPRAKLDGWPGLEGQVNGDNYGDSRYAVRFARRYLEPRGCRYLPLYGGAAGQDVMAVAAPGRHCGQCKIGIPDGRSFCPGCGA